MKAYQVKEDVNVTELARRLGRKQPSLSDFLNRKGGAAFATARKFAALVGVDVADLLGAESAGADEHMDLVTASPAQPRVVLDRINETIARVAKARGYSDEALEHALDARGLQGMSDLSEADAEELLRYSDAFVRSTRRLFTTPVAAGGSALDELSGGAGSTKKASTKRR
ncbi:MAG: hypothetical protein JWP97_5744 [Labilithrix sp.]|nr:hypothetical protein [Labilithrix sp.]